MQGGGIINISCGGIHNNYSELKNHGTADSKYPPQGIVVPGNTGHGSSEPTIVAAYSSRLPCMYMSCTGNASIIINNTFLEKGIN